MEAHKWTKLMMLNLYEEVHSSNMITESRVGFGFLFMSHKVVFPIGIAMLIARRSHDFIRKHVVVCMVLLPLLLFPFVCLSRLVFSPLLLSSQLIPPQGLDPIVLVLPKIRLLLHPRLVKPVDDGVLPRRHEHALDLAGILERDLPDVHGAVLAEVGPGRVNDGHVVPLVALYGVGLCQLRQVRDEVLGEGVPALAVLHAEVDVGAGELVDVEPDVFVPAMLDEILVLELVLACVDEPGGGDSRRAEVVYHFFFMVVSALGSM